MELVTEILKGKLKEYEAVLSLYEKGLKDARTDVKRYTKAIAEQKDDILEIKDAIK